MINTLEIEGYVTGKIWEWNQGAGSGRDILFRLCNYPDNAADPTGRKGIYITVRVPGGVLNGVPIGVRPQQHVVVTGYLASRDYTHSLADFLARARWRDAQDGEPAQAMQLNGPLDPSALIELRSLNEVIAASLRIIVDEADAPASKKKTRARK